MNLIIKLENGFFKFSLWLLRQAEALGEWAAGKLLVIEAEKQTMISFIHKALDEDLPEEEWGWSETMGFNEDFDSDGAPWGDDFRDSYLQDPDRKRDLDEDR